MATPVYCFMAINPKEAYYQLPDKKAFWDYAREANKSAGVEAESVLSCRSVDGGPLFLSVNKFPSMEAYEKWLAVKRKGQASRYFEGTFYLGVEADDWNEIANDVEVEPFSG